MGGGSGTRQVDKDLWLLAFAAAIPSSSNTIRVSLKGYGHIQMIFNFVNTTAVTGSAITLLQSQDVSGTGEKALNFTDSWVAANAVTDPRTVYQAVVGNTVTLPTTASTTGILILEIDAVKLDHANNFTSIRAAMATAAAQTVTVGYKLGNPARFAGESTSFVNPLIN